MRVMTEEVTEDGGSNDGNDGGGVTESVMAAVTENSDEE